MNTYNRISDLIKNPTHRIKYAFFILLGTVLVLIASQSEEPLKSILLEFSVTFGAITVLKILWEFLGGEPIEEAYLDSTDKISQQLAKLDSTLEDGFSSLSSKLLIADDLIKYNLGIERIWPSRREFRDDPKMGIKWWKDELLKSESISVLSISFWNDWMQDKAFRKALFKILEVGTTVRILIYGPGSSIQEMRAWAEDDSENRMISEIKRTVGAVEKIKSNLKTSISNNLAIRYTVEAHHMAQVLRLDNEMIIANYLHGLDGLSAPTIYVKDKYSLYYRVYSDQFERLWSKGKSVFNNNNN